MNKQAAASNQKIAVNGNPAVAESYLIDGNNYCKLRDIAYILRDTDACFQVGWLNMEKAISITTGQKYTGAGGKAAAGRKAAVSSLADIYLDGEYIQLEGYTIDGSNYFKLRDIAEFLGIKAEWDSETRRINLSTGTIAEKSIENSGDIISAYRNFLEDNTVKKISVQSWKKILIWRS